MLDYINTLLTHQVGTALVYSVLVATIIVLLNVLIVENMIFDVITGISVSVLVSSIFYHIQGKKVIDDGFYIISFVVLSVYVLFYYLNMKYITKLSEQSNTITSKDYEGKIGVVTTTIPKDGVGEVVITVSLQKIAKQTKIYVNDKTKDLTEIKSGTEVLVIENTDFLYVIPYDKMFNQ